jgi:hypothetical protein
VSRRVRIVTDLSDGTRAEMTHTLADTLSQEEANRYIGGILDGLRAAGFTVTATVLTEGEQPWEPS